MKKLLIVILSISILSSCDDLTSLNENPKRPLEVEQQTLFSNAQLRLANNLTSANVNVNIFRLLAQQWTQTTYIDESNYDLATREIPETFWNRMYRDVLKDLSESKKLLATTTTLDAAVKKNRGAVIEIVEVYSWSVLVNVWGDVPYSKALDFNEITPDYDDAKTIYLDLITRLNGALAAIDVASGSYGSSDLFYNGEMAQWVKFGNSLKLKLGMTLADEDPARAKTLVEQAAPQVFQSSDDNAVLFYSTVPPNTNPIWVDLVQSGRKDFVAANTLVDAMDSLDDPRVSLYFTTDASGSGYEGGTYGSNNNYAAFSKPADRIIAPNFETILLDYSEIEFYLAEAVERGMNVGGTALTHYNNGIAESMKYWGVSQPEIDAYLANPEVAYVTAAGNYRQKIGMQKWFALYNRGYEAWTEWRRLDYPELAAPEEAISDIPVRFTYPTNEQNLNVSNFEKASTAIGGNKVDTKLFWDVN